VILQFPTPEASLPPHSPPRRDKANICPVEAVAPPSVLQRLIAALQPGAAALGLQMALAGMIAFFFAQVLRLQYPSWSVFTVIVLLLSRYVGAVEEKAFLRLVGTILGGVIGYLATGAWQQSPLLYLGTTFVIVTLSVAFFGQSRAPYAFLLTGLTFIVIASNSMDHPDDSWTYALARIEEVLLGIVVSMVVQTTVFPTYANREFRRVLGTALDELASATPLAAGRFGSPRSGLAASLRDFPRLASEMRTLLRFGARESASFRQEIGRHGQTIDLFTRAASLLRSVEPLRPAPEPYRDWLSADMDRAGRLLSAGWEELREDGQLGSETRTELDEVAGRIGTTIVSLRTDPAVQKLDAAQIVDVSGTLLALRELRQVMLDLDALWQTPESLPSREETLALAPPWPDGFWLRHGVRAALAVVTALVIENWLSPPGGPFMVLCTFTFAALNALSPEGSGDRGTFDYVVLFTLIMAAASLALIAGTPLMASYAVFNVFIATWLFLFGYWAHDRNGVTVPMQISFLVLVAIIGLNAEEPVSFQKITGVFFGFVNGFLIASVYQRVLWPVLPQRQLQRGVTSYLRTVADCLPAGFDRLPLWQRTKLALTPSQGRVYLKAMAGPACPDDERQRLEEYLLTLQQLVGEISLAVGRFLPACPPSLAAELSPQVEGQRNLMKSGLNELADAFAAARPPADRSPEIRTALAGWDQAINLLRTRLREEDADAATGVTLMGLASRYRTSLVLLSRAFDEARALKLSDYLGDVAL
jgi:uncharacterized membrane protein YccC